MPVTPNLLLKANIAFPAEYAYWESDDGTGDPYYGFPYQWQTTLICQQQNHSDHATPTPYSYTSNDVKVGDWIATGVAGRALKIVQINISDGSNLDCILEDYERWNLFTNPDQSGTGSIPDGDGIIFRLGDDGLPALGPIEEGYLAPQTVDDLMARFIANNEEDRVLVHQPDHGLNAGDVIYANFDGGTGYAKVDSENMNRVIGVVQDINIPGVEYFRYRPVGKLVKNVSPPLWGEYGDLFYIDPSVPGSLTLDKPETNATPIYLQLDLPTRAILLERGTESSGSDISDSETYKYSVTDLATGQTVYTLPGNATSILYMAINGIENVNYTFNNMTKVLIFDPVATGYGVDADDEVFFIYKN